MASPMIWLSKRDNPGADQAQQPLQEQLQDAAVPLLYWSDNVDAMLVAVLDDAENHHGFTTTEDDGQLARDSATGTRSRIIHFALKHCCETERRSVQAKIAAFVSQFRLKDEAT
ncbi:hypothetical protein AAL_00055 [Moelleriella libera RCEF 2490]|uniref:Uncharacterized protein n=1 Tax=Moelleriella libera RCEF 2490 TaxID=1081109 RepID=A0A166UIT7_9HYPO|nr:hypothetical protein AAL_00055 [Moelleriella libera RCEF 2490]